MLWMQCWKMRSTFTKDAQHRYLRQIVAGFRPYHNLIEHAHAGISLWPRHHASRDTRFVSRTALGMHKRLQTTCTLLATLPATRTEPNTVAILVARDGTASSYHALWGGCVCVCQTHI